MALMVFQSFGVPTKAIESVLTTIQNLKFFLCTGYANSKGYAGGGYGYFKVSNQNSGYVSRERSVPSSVD
jgi:hypothetical protein